MSGPITPTDLAGVEAMLARRVIAIARSIVPSIDTLEGDRREDAIALLLGVAAEIPAVGSGRVKSMSRNGTSMTFSDVESAFSSDYRAALRSLVSGASVAGLPIGSFPEGRPITAIWPEVHQ